MSTQTPLRLLSLGAGWQSSRLALEGTYDAAIFADTQAEPGSVYRYLSWLRTMVSYPIHDVTQGDLLRDSLQIRTSKTGFKYLKTFIPFFVRKIDGKIGMLRRKCTRDYKIVPIQRQIRELVGKERLLAWLLEERRRRRGGRIGQEPLVEQTMGISCDEHWRMKPSGRAWIRNSYPLVTRGITRKECRRWIVKRGYPAPPKSACVVCPYHDDEYWRCLKENEPEEFARAVQFERDVQQQQQECDARQIGKFYLHSSCVPLDQVRFRSAPEEAEQLNMFNQECEGLCGI